VERDAKKKLVVIFLCGCRHVSMSKKERTRVKWSMVERSVVINERGGATVE
jgi:hypothetical protein